MTVALPSVRIFTAGALSLLVGAAGCAGDESATMDEPGAQADLAVLSGALLEQTWQVRMAVDSARAPFEGKASWSAFFGRDYPGALAAFKADGDVEGLARMHIELAALHEQAALLSANATAQVYGNDRQDVDPVAVAYLVAASHALKGSCAEAETALAELAPVPESVQAGAAWLEANIAADCPLVALSDLDGVPGTPPVVAPGDTPGTGDLPHYTLIEQTDAGRSVDAGDPLTLAALAAWHRAAAVQAMGGDTTAVDQLSAPWALRGGDPPADVLDLSDTWMFGGFLLAPADAAFIAAARTQGTSAVATFADRSPLAAALQPAVEGDELSPEIVLDIAPAVGRRLRDAMAIRSGGVQGFHEPFAALGRVAVLRAGMVVADGAGQYRDAGILRINALEQSIGPAADPVFFMSVAAWDAGNRNPLRAQEIMHQLVGEFPGLAAARYPLDAMHIRLSRNAAPAPPVH